MCAFTEDAKASVTDFGLVQHHLHANGTLFAFAPVCTGEVGALSSPCYMQATCMLYEVLHVQRGTPGYLCTANECSISL